MPTVCQIQWKTHRENIILTFWKLYSESFLLLIVGWYSFSSVFSLSSTCKHLQVSFYPYSMSELNLSKEQSVLTGSHIYSPSVLSAKNARIPVSLSARPTLWQVVFSTWVLLSHRQVPTHPSRPPFKWLLLFENFCWLSRGSALLISLVQHLSCGVLLIFSIRALLG